MKRILLVLLLIATSVNADATLKVSPFKTTKVTIMGVTIDEKFDNANKSFNLTRKHDKEEYDVYSKKLSAEFAPYEKMIVIVNPSSSKVVAINIVYPKFNKSMDECVKDKNLFLDNAFEKYGGQFENQYDITTNSKGDQTAIGNLFLDKKKVVFMCSKDADLVFLSSMISVLNREYQEYTTKLLRQSKAQWEEELKKLDNEKNEKNEKYNKMFQ